jgi:hypothetical protein
MPILKKSEWLRVEVPWPDVNERVQIARLAEAADRTAQESSRTASALGAVRNSLLQLMLVGDHWLTPGDGALQAA